MLSDCCDLKLIYASFYNVGIFCDSEKKYNFLITGLFALNNTIIIKYSRVESPLNMIICGVATPPISVATTSLLCSSR